MLQRHYQESKYTEWEEIFVNHISDKEFVCRMYKKTPTTQ